MDDLFNLDLLVGLDEFEDECDDFPIDSPNPNEIVDAEKPQVVHQMLIAIIGIILISIIIVIVSALIFNVELNSFF